MYILWKRILSLQFWIMLLYYITTARRTMQGIKFKKTFYKIHNFNFKHLTIWYMSTEQTILTTGTSCLLRLKKHKIKFGNENFFSSVLFEVEWQKNVLIVRRIIKYNFIYLWYKLYYVVLGFIIESQRGTETIVRLRNLRKQYNILFINLLHQIEISVRGRRG